MSIKYYIRFSDGLTSPKCAITEIFYKWGKLSSNLQRDWRFANDKCIKPMLYIYNNVAVLNICTIYIYYTYIYNTQTIKKQKRK